MWEHSDRIFRLKTGHSFFGSLSCNHPFHLDLFLHVLVPYPAGLADHRHLDGWAHSVFGHPVVPTAAETSERDLSCSSFSKTQSSHASSLSWSFETGCPLAQVNHVVTSKERREGRLEVRRPLSVWLIPFTLRISFRMTCPNVIFRSWSRILRSLGTSVDSVAPSLSNSAKSHMIVTRFISFQRSFARWSTSTFGWRLAMPVQFLCWYLEKFMKLVQKWPVYHFSTLYQCPKLRWVDRCWRLEWQNLNGLSRRHDGWVDFKEEVFVFIAIASIL